MALSHTVRWARLHGPELTRPLPCCKELGGFARGRNVSSQFTDPGSRPTPPNLCKRRKQAGYSAAGPPGLHAPTSPPPVPVWESSAGLCPISTAALPSAHRRAPPARPWAGTQPGVVLIPWAGEAPTDPAALGLPHHPACMARAPAPCWCCSHVPAVRGTQQGWEPEAGLALRGSAMTSSNLIFLFTLARLQLVGRD